MLTSLGRSALAVLFTATLVSCRDKAEPQPALSAGKPSDVVRLSPEAIATAGIQTAEVGTAAGTSTVALTGELAAQPWTPEEQRALSDASTADAKLRLAESNLERLSRLSRDGVVARQDLDAARAARDEARAAAAQADAVRANLGLSEGSSAAAGRRGTIWGLASLPEENLGEVHPGESVDVSVSAFPSRRFPGRVTAVSRSAEAATRSFTVRIAVEDPSGLLHPRMLATFAIAAPAPAGLSIPRSALLLEGDGTWVYLAPAEREFRRQRIETKDSSGDAVTVTSGLSPGQRVVVSGAQVLESERLRSRIHPAEEE